MRFMNSAVRFALVLLALDWSAGGVRAQELKVRTDHPDAVYQAGQVASFRVELSENATNGVTNLQYVLKKGGLTEIGHGPVSLTGGVGGVTVSLDEPGTVLAEVRAKTAAGKELKALAGAAFAPERIGPSAPRPDDFDAFWAAKIKELNTTPINPVLQSGASYKTNVEYFKITMDGFRGSKIHGQLARPTRKGKLPAMLIVQWAGVYPLQKSWAIGPADEGYLVLNIQAHDLPIDEPESFYKQLTNGALKEYPAIGNSDREQSYFLRMYLSAYRAADYLTQRPDWDGKTLVVCGTSQGGLQTLMLAGLHPRITAAMANVPAGCDHTGMLVGRAPGWPQWNMKGGSADKQKVLEASRYFDVVNFAAHIKCPVLVSAGMIDQTCPPAGVLAACNQVKGPHEVVILPLSDHHGRNNAQAAYNARMAVWKKAIIAGQPLPPPP